MRAAAEWPPTRRPALAEHAWRTPRLVLRAWRASDLAQSDAMARTCQQRLATQGWGFWAVERRDTREFIGFVGLNRPQVALPFTPCVEIGWRLARAHWRQGFAGEAAREALRVGFEELGLPEIVAFTALTNQPSQAVMRSLGMARDGQGDFDHPAVPAGHALRRHGLWRMARADWLARQAWP
jgi:RimJ/RimL family protein N-acetyltransferase